MDTSPTPLEKEATEASSSEDGLDSATITNGSSVEEEDLSCAEEDGFDEIIVFADVRGFDLPDHDDIIPKEIAICLAEDTEICHWRILRQQIPFDQLTDTAQAKVNESTLCDHGLKWDHEQGSAIESIKDFVYYAIPRFSCVITSDLRNAKYLSGFVTSEPFVSIAKLGLPDVSVLRTQESSAGHCKKHHINTLGCAYENVINMAKWFKANVSIRFNMPTSKMQD